MTEIIARPNFHYEGRGWNPITQWLAKSMYMEIRNKWVPLVNELIDDANHEWNMLHPEIGKMEEDSPEWKAYNKFMCEKFRPACDEVTKRYLSISPFKAGTDPESTNFVLELKNGKGYLLCDYTIVK